MLHGRTSLLLRLVVTMLALAVLTAGCGRDYTSRMREVLDAVNRHDPVLAEAAIDELIARGESGKNPEAKSLGLLFLERASIRQATARFRPAAEDLTHADQITELLDLTPQGSRNAAEYLFNDSAKLYHAPFYEKLMINISALSSFLAVGDVGSAMIEARRIVVMGEYFENSGYEDHPLIGLAWYFCGLAMEMGNQGSDAAFFYNKAASSFDHPVVAQARAGLGQGTSQIITIVMAGTGPVREPVHIPIGVALGWVNDSNNFGFDNEEHNVIAGLSAEELLTWVNFPVMTPAEYAFSNFELRTESTTTPVPIGADVAGFAMQQARSDRAAIAWSAISRAVTRIVAREAMQAVGSAVQERNGILGGILRLGGLAVQAGMQAADVPDTRGWNLMPAAIYIQRTPTHAGPQTVELLGQGPNGSLIKSYSLDVPEGGAVVVVERFLN